MSIKKVSDLIAEFLIEKEITQVFTVVGGGAMHLNDSFGHNAKINCLYQHHEQACAMAAEGYARVTNRPAVVCVTSGPGAVNALNGVVGAYQDSIPMLIISGQVKSTMLEKKSGLPLRTLGGQEFDIVSAVGKMTKYAETVIDASMIKYHLEKAYALAISGRPGPCWLDIPLDIQGLYVETKDLLGYEPESVSNDNSDQIKNQVKMVLKHIIRAKRPVLYAGNGIRLSGGMDTFRKLIERLNIPVVTCWDSIDLIETEHPQYCGRGGTMGDRAGNFAVQNSDFLLCIGNRLSVYQVGYNVKTWARAAYVVDVDIDPAELQKPTIRVDLPICADATDFMKVLLEMIDENEDAISGLIEQEMWNDQCRKWKCEYPVVQDKQKNAEKITNVYAFMDILSRTLPEGALTVVTNGSASVVGSQSYYISHNSRFMMNCAISSMGYGLPAAVGASVAAGRKSVICIEGDGSIMMNLQELQTIVTNQLPIKIFIINNDGYHQIRQTQNNIFRNGLVGVGPESKDLGFPNFRKLADAFDMEYCSINNNDEIADIVALVIDKEIPVLCEVFVDSQQNFEPKSATKRLADGTLYSPPLEDLAPFLPREELQKNMFIPLEDELE